MCVCVCVCVCERERERVCVCVCLSVVFWANACRNACVCARTAKIYCTSHVVQVWFTYRVWGMLKPEQFYCAIPAPHHTTFLYDIVLKVIVYPFVVFVVTTLSRSLHDNWISTLPAEGVDHVFSDLVLTTLKKM